MEGDTRNQAKKSMLDDNTHKRAFKKIASSGLPPLQSLRDDSGRYTAKPQEMDAILQGAWKKSTMAILATLFRCWLSILLNTKNTSTSDKNFRYPH
eukprot:12428383-Karenia_brevis.AAC.1